MYGDVCLSVCLHCAAESLRQEANRVLGADAAVTAWREPGDRADLAGLSHFATGHRHGSCIETPEPGTLVGWREVGVSVHAGDSG